MTTPSTGPSGTLIVGPVRVAYPHLMKPRTSVINGREDTRYEAVLLIPKEAPDLVEKVRAAIKTAFDKSPITDPGALTSGDWVYMLVKPRAYAFEATKGVALDILGARLVKKGDAIGAGGVNKAAVADALDALEIEAEADEAF
jgi:hypothetical protein